MYSKLTGVYSGSKCHITADGFSVCPGQGPHDQTFHNENDSYYRSCLIPPSQSYPLTPPSPPRRKGGSLHRPELQPVTLFVVGCVLTVDTRIFTYRANNPELVYNIGRFHPVIGHEGP